MRHTTLFTGIVVGSLAALSGCQSPSRSPMTVGNAALPVMERIALSANACWFKSKDPAFAAYKLAPDLNS